MKIRQRLLLGFLGVVAIFAVFGGYVYTIWQTINTDIENLDQLFEQTAEYALSTLDSTLHLAVNLETSRRALHEHLLGMAEARTEIRQSIEEFDSHYKQLKTGLQAEIDLAQAANNATLLDELTARSAGLELIEQQHEHFQDDVEKVLQLTGENRLDEAMRLLLDEVEGEIGPVYEQLAAFEESIERLTKQATERFDAVIHVIEGKIRRTERVILLVLGVAIVVAFILGYRTAETISGPVKQLEEAALAVEAGTFKLDALTVVADRTDELGQFARTFKRMASEINSREQRLKEQIKALRIEIDHSKQAEQVAEITETDFFQDLRSRARAMRNRKANR